MNVLFVNHTSAIGGAEHCLLDLLAELPASIVPSAAVPPGPLGDELSRRGVPWRPIPATEIGLRASTPQLLHGAARAARAAWAIRHVARTTSADLLHANSMRAAAVASLAVYPDGPPVVAHSHDNLPPSTSARVVERIAGLRGARFLALSTDSARTIGPRIDRRRIHVIGNGVDLTRFDADRIDRPQARSRVLPRDAPTLAVVAQITPWKGQDDAVTALARVRDTVPDAQLLLVGERKFSSPGASHDNEAFEHRLRVQVHGLGLDDCVHMMGDRDDVEQIARASDVLLIPSWNEPFGRVMLEAMAVGTPVVATAGGGPMDVIEDRRTGLLVSPRDPEALAAAALELLIDDELRARISAAARDAVQRYDRATWAARLVEIYEGVSDSTRRRTTYA